MLDIDTIDVIFPQINLLERIQVMASIKARLAHDGDDFARWLAHQYKPLCGAWQY
jgi:hypothetical protein